MTSLTPIRDQLGELAARRRRARLLLGWSVPALGAGWGIVAFFIIDRTLQLGRPERAVLLAILAAAVGAATWAWGRPWLRRRDSERSLALLVERQRGIDTDLVAALEFDDPAADSDGSAELRDRVVEGMAGRSRGWNLVREVPPVPTGRRLALLVGTFACLAVAAAAAPRHAVALLNRLALGSMHYPTRTRITELALDAESLPLTGSVGARRPFGSDVELVVAAAGELPPGGTVELRQQEGGGRATVRLEPDPRAPGTYRGRLPRLVESLSWTISLGDARTDPATLEVVPRPAVTLFATGIPPDYAGGEAARREISGRRLAVFEGSRVDLGVESANKPLAGAIASIAGREYPLEPVDESGRRWRLPAAGTPLAAVTEPLDFALAIRDRDGLAPERPVEGTIVVESDRPPEAELALTTRVCLPGAAPRIDYAVRDDFGVAGVRLLAWVGRPDGGTESFERDLPAPEPAAAGQPVRGKFRLDLAPLGLAPGDSLVLVLEARDARGGLEPALGHSRREILRIGDQAAVDSAIIQSDQRGEQMIGDMIRRLTGTEGER